MPVSRIMGMARYQILRCKLPLVRSRPDILDVFMVLYVFSKVGKTSEITTSEVLVMAERFCGLCYVTNYTSPQFSKCTN